MIKRLICLPAAVLAVVLIVAGCGDDSSTASISKAQFVKKANAVCKKGTKQLQVDYLAFVTKSQVTNPTEDDYAKLVDVVFAPNLQQEADEIRALGAPSGDEDEVEEIAKALEEAVEAAEKEPELVLGTEVFTKSSKLADEYGLKACGER